MPASTRAISHPPTSSTEVMITSLSSLHFLELTHIVLPVVLSPKLIAHLDAMVFLSDYTGGSHMLYLCIEAYLWA